jgi:hypothetical protein
MAGGDAVYGQGSAQRRRTIPIGRVHLLAGGRDREDTLSGGASWAAGRFPAWAKRDTQVRFIYIYFLFFLFFFCFLISFITFAFWLQFDSNQNLKFSNIQNNII